MDSESIHTKTDIQKWCPHPRCSSISQKGCCLGESQSGVHVPCSAELYNIRGGSGAQAGSVPVLCELNKYMSFLGVYTTTVHWGHRGLAGFIEALDKAGFGTY